MIDFVATLKEMQRADDYQDLFGHKEKLRPPEFRPTACLGNDHSFVTLSMVDVLHSRPIGTAKEVFEKIALPRFGRDGSRLYVDLKSSVSGRAEQHCEFVGESEELYEHVLDTFAVYGPGWRRAYTNRIVLLTPEGLWAMNGYMESLMSHALTENRFHELHCQGTPWRDQLSEDGVKMLQLAQFFIFSGRERCCSRASFFGYTF